MSNLITINVIIADRSYRLKVSPNDEEIVRKTVKMINDKVLEFKNSFAGKDMQDYLAMVVLWLATEQAVPTNGIIQHQEISDKLSHIENLIQKAFENK